MRTILLLSCFFVCVVAAETNAAYIIKALQRPPGLICLPEGKVSMALEFAKLSERSIIHMQMADQAAVLEAREQAYASGFLNRRIFIDQADLSRLVLVGRSCDLVVLPSDRKINAGLIQEVKRILHPWYGAALVADAQTAQAIGRHEERAGLHFAIAPPLAGSDDWAQWWHGADNNCVSTDTAFTQPATMQWTGKPFFASTRITLPLVGHGRLFTVWNGYEMDMGFGQPNLNDSPEGEGPMIMAQATGSGARLWIKRLSPAAWLQAARSTMLVDGERLLVADGSDLVVIQAATGREIQRYPLGIEEIKWLAMHEDRVYALGGTTTENQGRRSLDNLLPFRSSGKSVLVLERKSLKQVWRRDLVEGEDFLDPRSPAISNGRLFLCRSGDQAEAWSLANGKTIWSVKAGFDRGPEHKPFSYEWDSTSRHPVSGYAIAGIYVISGPEMLEGVALAQEDGKRLWSVPTKSRNQYIPLSYENMLFGRKYYLDPFTREEIKDSAYEKLIPHSGDSCSRSTVAPYMLGEHKAAEKLKSSCSAGSFVANGILWKFPSPCTGCYEWRGFLQQASQEKGLPPPPPQLVQGAIQNQQNALVPGWLSYRGDAARSSATKIPVAEAAKIAWEISPNIQESEKNARSTVYLDAEFVPLPNVSAGDVIISAHNDGSVTAYRTLDGTKLWRSFTAGRIHSTPAIWHDRVFVGSCDGHLYAFSLVDGSEIWRLRVAPEVGRMMLYEQLGSRWPVTAAPIVFGDTVIASAGTVGSIDGVHAICANAKSGNIIWRQDKWDAAETNDLISGGAQFAAVGKELLYHGGDAPPIRIDAQQGGPAPAFPKGSVQLSRNWPGNWPRKGNTVRAFEGVWRKVKGQDIGVLSERWIMYGGRRIWTDQRENGTWRTEIKILPRDEQGRGLFPAINVVNTTRLPAWDEAGVLFSCSGVGKKNIDGLVYVSRQRLEAALSELIKDARPAAEILEMNTKKPKAGATMPRELLTKSIDPRDKGLSSWKIEFPYNWRAWSWVLTPNALVFAYSRVDKGQHKIVAVSRSDGSPYWEVDLPERPVYDGLSIDKDGRIMVSFD